MPKLAKLKPRVFNAEKRFSERKVREFFYATKEWREARKLSVAMHAYQCARCGRRGCRLFVDHIIERRDGGASLAQGNLEPLCGSCHSLKTAEARRQRLDRKPGAS
jgi:5-methylcytosine-specific restriction endonuclease McrA